MIDDTQEMEEVLNRANRVRLLILDVDGVLTDGKLYLGSDGSELKSFHILDGLGIKMLLEAGLQCAVISGRHSDAVERRMRALGVEHVHHGIEDKLPVFSQLLSTLALDPVQAAHVGDDLSDLPIMSRVGLAITVRNGSDLIKPYAQWETSQPGGEGAVREVCELILRAQGRLQPLVERYR